MNSNIEILEYIPEYGFEVLKLWRTSFQRAMGLVEQNKYTDLAGQLAYFRTIDHKSIRIALDTDNSGIVGFMVQSGPEIDHLYIHVDYQGIGLGSGFIELAKNTQSYLSLYTFKLNTNAQNFYESHGFEIVNRGYAEFDTNPWATDKEQLADVRYEWNSLA